MYLAIILLPLLGSISSGLLGRKVGIRGAQLITCIFIVVTVILACIIFLEVGLRNVPVSIKAFAWIDSESLNVTWGFFFDSLTVSMSIPVLIISFLVHIYSIGYMSHDPHNQRFFSYLSLFTYMMIILITANNFILMFVGWEGVGVCSYLLVCFWFTRISANQSSISAFLTNRVGDCFLTIGMFAMLWSFGNIDYFTIFSLAPFLNENTITIVGICLLIGAMAKSVRRCAIFWNGEELSKHWPNVFLTAELDKGENLMLNIASPMIGEIRPKEKSWVAPLVKIPMIKAILLKVYLPVVSSHGLQLACDRLNAANSYFELLSGSTVRPQTNCINNLKVKSRQSKGILIQKIGTSRLPKAENCYGNGGIVVPEYLDIYCSMKVGRRERIPDFKIRRLSTSAGTPVQSKSDTSAKLLRLREHCNKNPDVHVNLQKIYRLMYDPLLYELAYNKLKSSPGNMTPDITSTILDGMSIKVIEEIIIKLKDNSFKFSPARKVDISKVKRGTRPFTIVPARDKLVKEVMKMILEAIFEPTFSDNNHGFRPNRSCRTALIKIKERFGVATWYIEGNISNFFDSFDQEVLMRIIERKIKDKRFTDLIRKFLKAGYMEYIVFKHSVSATPQGCNISPILSNIYLNELDKFLEVLKLDFDTGGKVVINPAYNRLRYLKSKETKPEIQARILKLILKTPYYIAQDPTFKKLTYIRYADDWFIGIRGSKEDCFFILEKIRIFLKKELSLDLSINKTFITNANLDKARFLGTDILRRTHLSFFSSQFGFNKINGKEIRLEAPKKIIFKKLADVGFLDKKTPVARFLWLANDKDTIITLYNSVYKGLINYYSFAKNRNKISSSVHYILKTSCAKLLAAKFKLETQSKVFAKFGSKLKGENKIGFLDAIYGMDVWDLKVNNKKTIPTLYAETMSKATLLNLRCAVCYSDYRVGMHHIKMMKNLNPKLNKIDALMSKRNRKQTPLCRKSNLAYHHRGEKEKLQCLSR